MHYLVIVDFENVPGNSADYGLYKLLVSQHIFNVLGVSSDRIRFPSQDETESEDWRRPAVSVILDPEKFTEGQRQVLKEKLSGMDIDVSVKFGPSA